MSDWETLTPTMSFRWYIEAQETPRRLQQRHYSSRGEVWIDVPTVFDASVPLSGEAQRAERASQ